MIKTVKKLLRGSFPDEDSECVLWHGGQNHKGYGYVRVTPGELPMHPVMARVHRLAYWVMRGPFDLDLTIDHTCGVRLCINPYHLRACSLSENSIDGNFRRWHNDELETDHGF